MDYPIKTLSQLRPILKGFRKAAGLTQAMMASHLGVTQQTYAQLEANPAVVSVERLFRVLRVLNVDLTLTQTAVGLPKTGGVERIVPPSPASRPTGERVAATRAGQTGSPERTGSAKREAPPKKKTAGKYLSDKGAAKSLSGTYAEKRRADVTSDTRRGDRKTGTAIKKRENW